MKVIVDQNAFVQTLLVSSNIANKKTSMPIMLNVLLSASQLAAGEGVLTVAATDGEIAFLFNLEGEVLKPGSITVRAKMMYEVVNELPTGPVTMELGDKGRLNLSADRASINLIGVDASEFPIMEGLEFEPEHPIERSSILDMISNTLYAVSHDESRYNLNGVCFESLSDPSSGKKLLRAIATDGNRLSLVSRPIESFALEESIIVPTKGLVELKRILENVSEEEVSIGCANSYLVVKTERAKISMRLIDGQFPNYNLVVPERAGVQIGFGVAELNAALRRMVLVVTDRDKCIRFEFDQNMLTINSQSPELGEGVETVAINYDGPPMVIGFNGRFLLDILSTHSSASELIFELQGEKGAAVIYNPKDPEYISVVMPMRLIN